MAKTKRRELTAEELEDAARIRDLVKSSGVTQQEIGLRCGWSGQQAVQAYISGNTPVNIDAAFRFSQALGVPLDAISPRLAAKAVELFGATQAGQAGAQTFEALLSSLHVDPESMDNDGRLAIARLAKTYEANPAEGAKIAKAILALVGTS